MDTTAAYQWLEPKPYKRFTQQLGIKGRNMLVWHLVAGIVVVRLSRARFGRPNSIAPVVSIRKAPARPPDDRRAQLAQRFQYIQSEPIAIGNRRIRPHPQPVITTSPQMLGKMAEQEGRYRAYRFIRKYRFVAVGISGSIGEWVNE